MWWCVGGGRGGFGGGATRGECVRWKREKRGDRSSGASVVWVAVGGGFWYEAKWRDFSQKKMYGDDFSEKKENGDDLCLLCARVLIVSCELEQIGFRMLFEAPVGSIWIDLHLLFLKDIVYLEGIKPLSTLIVLGSGGHTAEMLNLLSVLHTDSFTPRLYIAAATDYMSLQKARLFENSVIDKEFRMAGLQCKLSRVSAALLYKIMFTAVPSGSNCCYVSTVAF
ncbi:hypothetical protein RHMOL_Rhmol13G0195900 [Rhododendron molle]|uniref:Uncharacterized protein n=1 Tax=Rhododendron molle TaxID=49168 RepID=A0ACC0L8Y6_RHOML|nr:hypothetical protein RHMOL_Rhmol13G0195900 [Rhododendron molle]